MSSMGMRGQQALTGAELEARYAAMNMHFCGAQCGTPIWVGKDYCDRCREESDALDLWQLEQELERQDRVERRQRVLVKALEAWLVTWDWLKANALDYALLLFVAGAVAYIVTAYSDMWVAWFLGLAR